MKYAVHPGKGLEGVDAKAEGVHFVRPPTLCTWTELRKKCKGLKNVSMGASTLKRVSRKVRQAVKESGIALNVQEYPGRAIGIELEKLLEVANLKKDFLSLRKIQEKTGIPKSTVHYLVRKAKRAKVKKGKAIVYLT